ncbi:hypothetical protein POM88_018070 [Heracleum sosnowskyi]|uniref:Uncharacterized protein n=1 Tax=Heracleum sosnowskyi TaxID=360622 RepID=A0AAD8ISZ9_9APIA|nr:hypothetical protein POM88_018070 [Heracleum sosnowskyi]
MYVTRFLSHYENNPESLSLPPEGPNSGYLVIQDEEAETSSWFGSSKNRYLKGLPLPYNNISTIRTHFSANHGVYTRDVVFIPVINQPLSCNRYYAVLADGGLGKSKGEGFTCLKEEQIMCLHCKTRKPDNIIAALRTKQIAHDGSPPDYLTKKCWNIRTKRPKNYKFAEALGLNSSLRARITHINIQISDKSSEAVKVGMWYCPFMFVKDRTLVYQIKNSMYYEMTLEQQWEQIFECKNEHINSNIVRINAAVQKEVVLVAGRVAIWDEKNVVDRAIWFTGIDTKGKEVSVGLSLEIVERMKWEEERVGYVGGKPSVTFNRVEEFRGGAEGWRKFGCYILVERFVLKRMDGSLVMTYDFKHTHQVRCIWE